MSMTIQTTHGIWIIVEVNGETHYIPPGLGLLSFMNNGDAYTEDSLSETREGKRRWASMVAEIRDYVDHPRPTVDNVDSIEAWEGWGAQYHMSGYLDQTDWVLGDTEEEAVKECKELYGDEDEEEDEDEEV